MTHSGFPDNGRGQAAGRAAEALLRALGGDEVYVLVPAAAAGNDGSELGVQGVVTEMVHLAPVAVRTTEKQNGKRRLEVVIAAASLQRERQIDSGSAAAAFFEGALGLLYQEQLLSIESVIVDEFRGVPYLYRLRVRG